MEETKKPGFTPGPWVAAGRNEAGEKIRKEWHGGAIAIANAHRSATIGGHGDVFGYKASRANAHLIASAPELYALAEELEKTQQEIIDDTGDASVARYYQERQLVTRAILAKARGEAQ